MISVDMTLGEALDRLSILQLKLAHAPASVQTEYDALRSKIIPFPSEEFADMLQINTTLWQLEDHMHALETDGSDEEAADYGRAIVRTNRERCRRKNNINQSVGQSQEFKTY